jgi:hypothetical protein
MNHLAADLARSGCDSIAVRDWVRELWNRLLWLYRGQWRSVCRTVCADLPQGQWGRIPGTCIEASHAFSPITSVRKRKRAVASALVSPSYRGIVRTVHGVSHVLARRPYASFSHLFLHVMSAHLAISVVDLYRCWWPPCLSLRRLADLLRPAGDCRAISARWARRPLISSSLSWALSRRSSGPLLGRGGGLRALRWPLGAVAHILLRVCLMCLSTGWFRTVAALCIATMSM